MITVLLLAEAYSKPTRLRKPAVNPKDEVSVWIVPKGTGSDDDEDIDEVLARDGILVLERVTNLDAQRCAEDIRRKFERAGIEVKRELLCND